MTHIRIKIAIFGLRILEAGRILEISKALRAIRGTKVLKVLRARLVSLLTPPVLGQPLRHIPSQTPPARLSSIMALIGDLSWHRTRVLSLLPLTLPYG